MRTSAAVERYDIRRRSWKLVRALPIAVNHPTAVAYRGRLYVHGGYRAELDLTDTSAALLRYDPRAQPLAPAAAVADPARRARGGGDRPPPVRGRRRERERVAALARDLRLQERSLEPRAEPRRPRAQPHHGGRARRALLRARRARRGRTSPSRSATTPQAAGGSASGRCARARGGIASARLSDGRIVVFGGEQLGPGGTTIAEVELFDPRTGRWRSLPDMRTPRHGLGGVALGRRVFAIEGGTNPGLSFSERDRVPRRAPAHPLTAGCSRSRTTSRPAASRC